MALTITPKKTTVFGDCRIAFADITWDNSYATNGLSLKSTDFGVSDALSIRLLVASTAGGLLFEYDHTNKKLKAHYPSGGATAPAALAAPIATSTATAGATPVTSSAATVPVTTALKAGKSLEVANATDLSTVTVRVMAVLSA